jgi:L,D-transpeptidase-like protein
MLTAGAHAAGKRVPAISPIGAPLAMAASQFDVRHLRKDVLQLALNATSCAVEDGTVGRPQTLTVIDYSRASTRPRFWVLDLVTREVLFEELVAHGSGSGDNFATRFSNDPDSHQSSLGLFLAEDAYTGKNGYSLRLRGLEPSNDRAIERAIVIHGASYVSHQSAAALGRLGRSWGCPALRPGVAAEIIDRVKGGGLIFAYYPDKLWLEHSPFLSGCAAH